MASASENTKAPESIGAWKAYVDTALINPAIWNVHDNTISKIVAEYNAFLRSTSHYVELDWTFVKAMCWVETGGGVPKWSANTMQAGVANDPGLPELLCNDKLELYVPVPFRSAITLAAARSTPEASIKAGVGVLLMRLSISDIKSVEDPAGTVSSVTVKPGDNYSLIARRLHTTVESLTAQNLSAKLNSLRPGLELKYRLASYHRVITGWRAITPETIAARYNGGRDAKYAAKLRYAIELIGRIGFKK